MLVFKNCKFSAVIIFRIKNSSRQKFFFSLSYRHGIRRHGERHIIILCEKYFQLRVFLVLFRTQICIETTWTQLFSDLLLTYNRDFLESTRYLYKCCNTHLIKDCLTTEIWSKLSLQIIVIIILFIILFNFF